MNTSHTCKREKELYVQIIYKLNNVIKEEKEKKRY